jgi:hypothetical protein
LQQTGFRVIGRCPNHVLMNGPVDSRSFLINKFWEINSQWSKKYPLYDKIIWPLLYPFEILLTSLLKESPAQEFMICRAIK